ncbi:MAG TPA: hypothetical protein VKU01_04570 [Bryobacteraceae bacterium]|nr:hypothetical protein [Bryobacteraceae bacterium]
MAALRKDLLSRTLVHYFQDQVSRHRESGSSEWAQVYEDLQLAQSCEERGSEAWRETLKALNGKLVVEGREKLLLIPGGYLFFEQFQLLPKIQETAKKLPDTATDLMARIAQYLSADGLGFVAVMLDEGRNPGRALELLGQLDNKNGAAALYLHARAKSQLAGQLIEQAKVPEAVGAWKEALQLAQKEPSDFPASMFKALAAKITEEASERINAEAVRLKDAGKLDEAIALVEQCREFGLTDLLCVLFCDRGEKRRADKSFDAAREDFGRVLKLAPDHKRAKEGMAITFNNEGVAAQDTKRRLQLYEKAHEWDPNHSVVRANLAVELREKAIRDITDARAKYNSLGPKKYRAALNAGIALMERAVRLADPAFTAEQLKQLEQQARQGEQRIQGYLSALNEEPLKSTLFNLGMAYLFRFQAPS